MSSAPLPIIDQAESGAPAVGSSVQMADALRRVRGDVDYCENLSLPGMLHGRVLRSPFAHARILSVDVQEALRQAGVAAIVSAQDLAEHPQWAPLFGPMIRDQMPVAVEKVRYLGDVVAAVAAATPEDAERALGYIDVEYEELPAILDAEQALDGAAPLVHPGPRDVIESRQDIVERSLPGTNIVNLFTQRKGDIERGFAAADLVVTGDYTSPAVEHVPLETHNCLVDFTCDQITIWSSTQGPFMVQQQIARMFGVPAERVRVIVTTLGGGFGSKVNCKLEPITALLSWKSGRPVKLVLPREESFLVNTQHAVRTRMRTGVNRDGTLVAQEGTCFYDCGPYADSSPNIITRAYSLTGPYRLPNVKTDSYGVYTNNVPAGAFRGYGITQVSWAHETQMDAIADALSMDPLELRLRNLLRTGEPFSTGEPLPECHYAELLEEAARRIAWHSGPLVVRDGSTVRAKGVSCIIKGGAALPSTAAVVLHADDHLDVLVSSVEMGQGAQTVLGQIAADAASMPLCRVTVSRPDTAKTPYESNTVASRTTFTTGTAVTYAVQDVKGQLMELAAAVLEVSPDDLVLCGGQVRVVGDPESVLSYGEVIKRAGRSELTGKGAFGPTAQLRLADGQGRGSVQWHPGVAACEVEIDLETGRYQVLQLHVGVYVGRMINPLFCQLQVEGSALFGLGQAQFEELLVDGAGQALNLNLSEYMIPSFEDVPRTLSVHILENPEAVEVHGIGETAVPPIAPAIGNAVSRGIGVRLRDLPITPERVLRAIQQKQVGIEPDVYAGLSRG